LCFSSDTDILFLLADEQERSRLTPAVQEFLHRLLDAGLDVGHSMRTIDECIHLPKEDFESQISLLEARYICGDKTLFRKFFSILQKKVDEDDHKNFVQELSNQRQARHHKYGNSSKLLEPNIKNSAGGLRDIHSAFWIMCGTGTIRLPKMLDRRETAILQFLHSTAIKKQFPPSFLKEIRLSLDALLRVRNEMHLHSKTLHDTLEFRLQPSIASHLRYRSHSKRTQVEHFMQDYYIASRSVALFCSRVIDWANDRWPADAIEVKKKKNLRPFSIRGRHIHMAKPGVPISNEFLLRAFLLRSERNAEFSSSLEDTILIRLKFLKPLQGQIETDLFRLLLHRPNGVGNALKKMNELGLLERWIPEWKPMVSFFQHNLYHFYTADEHTVITVANAESLGQSSSSIGEVYRSLTRRDILYLGCLLHDIAKPLHIGKHELKGIPIAKRILHRLRYDDVIEDVTFLIRYHLLMEQVAFRRNLNDVQTIVDFAQTFERIEQLDYLYILTHADLSAVNRTVMTDWKERLLQDLYRKARTVLEEEMTSSEIHERAELQTASKKELVVQSLGTDFPQEEIEEHLALLSETSYLSACKSEDIMRHLQTIRTHETVSTLFKPFVHFTEVTFIAKDAPGVLSKLCGVLTANDANIFDAQVFTRRDGIIIDKFHVVDSNSNHSLPEESRKRISHDIQEVIAGRVDIAHLIERHRMRWKRRLQPPNPNIRCDVEFEDHPRFTIIDVYGPDALGFLYKITETISHIGLNITFAKIATRVDGIVDSFYVVDGDGKKLDNPEKRESAKQEILTAIRTVSESELVTTKK
jgi:[protein-PII] uridylyltransferase